MLGRTSVRSVVTGVAAARSRLPALSSRVAVSLITATPAVERLTIGNESVVIVDNGSVAPIASPAMPTPTETSDEPDRETHPEGNARSGNVQPGVRVPARPHDHWGAVNNPWIVCGNVNDFRGRRFNDDCLFFGLYLHLFVGLQIPSCLCARAHDLHRVHHSPCLTDVGLAERRGPRKVLVHVGEHGGELGERFDARIPRLLIDGTRQILPFEVRMVLYPAICLNDFGGIRCPGEYL